MKDKNILPFEKKGSSDFYVGRSIVDVDFYV